jgi:hypothetical protein
VRPRGVRGTSQPSAAMRQQDCKNKNSTFKSLPKASQHTGEEVYTIVNRILIESRSSQHLTRPDININTAIRRQKMSLAYPIYNVKDLAEAFAAKDEFISALSCHLYQNRDYIMDPTDDYYVAPFCFMSTLNSLRNDNAVGFLVFSSMVPFMRKREHDAAINQVKRYGHHKAPTVGTVDSFQKCLKLTERDIWTFTSDGCFPAAEDVSKALEDEAIRVVCDLMKWRFPSNWRDKRDEVGYVFAPVFHLAEYPQKQQQQQKRQQQQQQQHFFDAKEYATDDDKKNDQEEKKETTSFDYLPLPPLESPNHHKRSGYFEGNYDITPPSRGFFERNADIVGNTFISRYSNNYDNYNNMEEDDDGNTFISTDDLYDDQCGI